MQRDHHLNFPMLADHVWGERVYLGIACISKEISWGREKESLSKHQELLAPNKSATRRFSSPLFRGSYMRLLRVPEGSHLSNQILIVRPFLTLHLLHQLKIWRSSSKSFVCRALTMERVRHLFLKYFYLKKVCHFVEETWLFEAKSFTVLWLSDITPAYKMELVLVFYRNPKESSLFLVNFKTEFLGNGKPWV